MNRWWEVTLPAIGQLQDILVAWYLKNLCAERVKNGSEMAESYMYKQQGDQFHTAQVQYANIYDLIEKEDYMRHFILLGGGRINLPPLEGSK